MPPYRTIPSNEEPNIPRLKQAGIEGINLKGGINAWSLEVDPSVPQY
jgi:hypothetical protein